jgi:hypothetical protein
MYVVIISIFTDCILVEALSAKVTHLQKTLSSIGNQANNCSRKMGGEI